jgi:uncharacterized membrane protein (DUF4010 family)
MPLLLNAIVVSACLGALVGLIRQWSEQKQGPREPNFGGVRTHILWALLGCLSAYLSEHYSSAVLPMALFLIGAQLMVLHWRDNGNGAPGSTSFVAALLTCLIGAMVQWGHQQSAILIAALTMVTLGIKQPVHAWTRHFTADDIRSTLQFVAITGVVLPLVPNRAFGPFEAFNPFSTWLMVVLISGLGFAGYIAMRLLGAQAGITVTGVVGGIASSTATTLAFSRRSKDDPEYSDSYALAVVIACTIMIVRVGAMIAAINPQLLSVLVVPLAAMAIPGVIYGGWSTFVRRGNKLSVTPPAIHNPLSLGLAIKFALLYAIFAFLVKAATSLKLTAGLLPLSFLSGLTDMDAIALLMANNLRDGSVPADLAAKCVVVGAVANSLVKATFAITVGSPTLKRHVCVVLGFTILTGVAAIFWLI